jgi:hypothetical protein
VDDRFPSMGERTTMVTMEIETAITGHTVNALQGGVPLLRSCVSFDCL